MSNKNRKLTDKRDSKHHRDAVYFYDFCEEKKVIKSWQRSRLACRSLVFVRSRLRLLDGLGRGLLVLVPQGWQKSA
jgi:hypothetical protein